MKLFKIFIIKILSRLGLLSPTYYINGPENLPEPLSAEEERKLH